MIMTQWDALGDREKELRELPEKLGEIWQVHAMRVSNQYGRPRWCILFVSCTTDSDVPSHLTVVFDIVTEFPTVDLLREKLEAAMLRPRRGRPIRPSSIQFRSESYLEGLRPWLERNGVKAQLTHQFRCWDDVFSRFDNDLLKDPVCVSVSSAPGVGYELLRGFYASAAQFFEQLPFMPSECTFEIERGESRWYGVLSSNICSEEPGLLLVESGSGLDPAAATMEDLRRHFVSLCVSFGRRQRVHADDLQAIHAWNLPITDPIAYPIATRRNPGGSVRAPLNWELDMLERCLHVVPGLLIFQHYVAPDQSRPFMPEG